VFVTSHHFAGDPVDVRETVEPARDQRRVDRRDCSWVGVPRPTTSSGSPARWERKDTRVFKASQTQALRVSGRTP
jgi:hypothetical protein